MSRDGHEVAGPHGSIRITGDAIARMIVDAAQLTEGVRAARPRRGVDVEIEDGTAQVHIEIACSYGTILPNAARNVQATIAAGLGLAAGLQGTVDVTVVELDG